MKTILKLYGDGKFETVDTMLIQSNVANNYKFTENAITVPKIIEYPPTGYRNYFIEKTSVSGYVNTVSSDGPLGVVVLPNEDDRTSDYINVVDWDSTTIRVRFRGMDNSYRAWVNITFFDATKRYLRYAYDDYVGQNPSIGDYTFEYKIPSNSAFMRVSVNYYDSPNTEVKVSVEKGNTSNSKHYLALEDLPDWVRDTGNPISIFPDGIVVKGEVNAPFIFRDDFNRADNNTLGSDWEIISGAYSIRDNRAIPTNTNAVVNVALVDVGIQNYVAVNVGVFIPVMNEGVIFRLVDVNNYFIAQFVENKVVVSIVVNGVSTVIGAVNYPYISGQAYELRIELRNTEIKIFVNNTLIGTITNSSHMNGSKCGLVASTTIGSIGTFDNFEVKQLT